MPLFDHFNFIAPFYDQVIPINNIDFLVDIIGLPVDGLLLDAGGGTGRVAIELVGLAQKIFVADLSRNMLIQASEKGDLYTVQTHTEKVPFPDNSFDRIIMIDALHHVCDHQETADELWRVLKHGGRIVIEEPDIRNLGVKMMAIAEKVALMRSHFINPHRIVNLFPNTISDVRIETIGSNAWVIIDKN